MRIKEVVISVLQKHERARNNDRFLQFCVWNMEGLIKNKAITWDAYMRATDPETIRRTRQKVQEEYPQYRATDPEVANKRLQKETTRGGFVETVKSNLL